MAACDAPRHIGGDLQAPGLISRQRDRKRQPHARGAVFDRHLVNHWREAASPSTERRTASRASSLSCLPRVGLAAGASSATSGAAIESDTEMAPSLTLTSSAAQAGIVCANHGARQSQPGKRDEERADPARAGSAGGMAWTATSGCACDRSTASPRTGTPCCRRCRCCPRCRPRDRR